MAGNGTNRCYLTIREAGELIHRQELSPVELTRAFLDRIEAIDGRLHAYITLLKDEAMATARSAEAEILRGGYRGPLHGIPIGLKDLYDTAGIRTTAGSKVDKDRVPTVDATTTARLKAAGCVLLGKLGMHEFALGGPDPTTGFTPPPESLELGLHSRGLQQRLWSRGGRRIMHGSPGILHRGIDSRTRIAMRHRRTESYLRPRKPLWCGDSKLVPGPLRPHDLDSGRHGLYAPGYSRP